MSKELEAYFKIDNTICLNSQNIKFGIDVDEHIDCQNVNELVNCLETIKKALEEREAIDNSNHSEALECLEEISKEEVLFKNRNTIYMGGEKINSFTYKNTIGNYFKGIDTIKQALLKAQEQEKELKSEINVLFSYMEFTKLFFEIFNLNYSNETFTLSLIPTEQYNIENVDLKICLIKEDADKILKVAELLEKEGGE